MLTKRFIGLVATCLLVVFAIGCGSGSDDETSGSLTTTQFVQQGDKICQEAVKRKEATFQKLLKENANKPALNQAEQEEVVTQVAVAPVEQMTKELSALGLPEGKEEEAEEMVESFESAVQGIKDDPRAALEGSGQEFAEANKLAKALGFNFCSSI